MIYGIHSIFDEAFALANYCFPLEYVEDRLKIAYVPNFSSEEAIRKRLFESEKDDFYFEPYPISEVNRLIHTYYTIELKDRELYKKIREYIKNEQFEKLFLFVVQKAQDFGASDIHISQDEGLCLIRFRLKGKLKTFCVIEEKLAQILGRIIKVKGNADISRSLRAIDTRIQIPLQGQALDIRVSIISTMEGEKISLRLLGNENVPKSIKDLGISEEDIQKIEKALSKESGTVLVTGPTGSGKSSSIRCFLHEINDGTKHIISIEDPVEYKMSGVTQIQVDNREESGFADGVRSILRQDPDILFIGEIRDEVSAEVAMKASITGHLVFTTLHTKTPSLAIERLENLGIDRHLIFSSISMIINQRLIGEECKCCQTSVIYQGEDIEQLGLKNRDIIHLASGCEKCGYSGIARRVPLMSIVKLDDKKREEYSAQGILDEDDGILKQIIQKFKRKEISLAEARRFL